MGSLRQTIMLRVTLVLAGIMLTLSNPKDTYIVVKVPGESISLNPSITPSTPRTPEIETTPEEMGTTREIETTPEKGTTPEIGTTPATSEIPVTDELPAVTDGLPEKSWIQEQTVENGTLLTTLNSSPGQLPHFRVKFDLWIEKFGGAVASVLHIGNHDGIRLPAVYLHQKTKQLQINFHKVGLMHPGMNAKQWYTIDIERASTGNEAVYKIMIDEELKGNWTRSETAFGPKKVNVYLSSPWRAPL